MPYAAFVLRTPQGPGQTYPLNREVIHIGRHTSNDIVINERRVSRYHAEIRFERGQFVLYDLGSLNGVSVNGAMTRQAVLRNGDIIALGSYSFVFERR
jgi:pSer/pThr/pTyr-binding forkhead associated (FHA) protein